MKAALSILLLTLSGWGLYGLNFSLNGRIVINQPGAIDYNRYLFIGLYAMVVGLFLFAFGRYDKFGAPDFVFMVGGLILFAIGTEALVYGLLEWLIDFMFPTNPQLPTCASALLGISGLVWLIWRARRQTIIENNN